MAEARGWVSRDMGALCRQLLGDVVAVGLLVRWILSKVKRGTVPLLLAPFQHIVT